MRQLHVQLESVPCPYDQYSTGHASRKTARTHKKCFVCPHLSRNICATGPIAVLAVRSYRTFLDRWIGRPRITHNTPPSVHHAAVTLPQFRACRGLLPRSPLNPNPVFLLGPSTRTAGGRKGMSADSRGFPNACRRQRCTRVRCSPIVPVDAGCQYMYMHTRWPLGAHALAHRPCWH